MSKLLTPVALGLLLLGLLILGVRLVLLRRAIRRLGEDFRQKLGEDSNTLLDCQVRDPALRALASELNEPLRQLRTERRRYQQGDLELKEAVTNISHDLRTPLTAIRGYLELLGREEKSQAAERYLAQIENRVEAMRGLTEELFRYSVISSARELHPERLDLARTLAESLFSFYGALEEKGIQPEVEIPEEPVWRELDPSALNRVFANVLSNALKYSDGDLRVSMEPSGEICFVNRARGLDPVAVGRLFDRFYTVEAGRNSSGLGLSIARALTQRMGGTIVGEYRAERLCIRVYFGAEPKESM